MFHCNTCFDRKEDSWFSSRSLKDLVVSAQSGCFSCTLLEESIFSKFPDVRSPANSNYQWTYRSDLHKGLIIQITLNDETISSIELFSLEGNKFPWEFDGPSRPISADTSSDDAFHLVASCLVECAKNHPQCWENGNSNLLPPLPTRILDVGDGGPYSDVKLIETQSEAESNRYDRYICLSHCWGLVHSIKTIKSNIELHKTGISWSALPPTFQEAVDYTRRLRIRYLWIDSLCIVQDDKDDWRQESMRMASVYRNASITIAATRSTDNQHGLYSKADPKYCHTELTGTKPDGSAYSVCVRHQVPHLEQRLANSEFPLLARAWVFQERLLSRRVIHFTNSEIIWECMEAEWCECLGPLQSAYTPPQEANPESLIFFAGKEPPPKVKHAGAIRHAQSITALTKRWHEIVQEYSPLKLTYETDRFPALVGLSAQMQHNGAGAFIAGLWKENLPQDLTWFVSQKHSPPARPSQWCAPTWSWASVGGGACYGHSQAITRMYCKVVEVSCTPVGSSALGELSSAHLVITGPLLRAVLIPICWNNGKKGLNFDYKVRLEPYDKENNNFFTPDYPLYETGPGMLELGAKVFCLGLFHSVFFTDVLVLRCVDTTRQIYERIGYMSHGAFTEDEDRFLDACHKVITIK